MNHQLSVRFKECLDNDMKLSFVDNEVPDEKDEMFLFLDDLVGIVKQLPHQELTENQKESFKDLFQSMRSKERGTFSLLTLHQNAVALSNWPLCKSFLDIDADISLDGCMRRMIRYSRDKNEIKDTMLDFMKHCAFVLADRAEDQMSKSQDAQNENGKFQVREFDMQDVVELYNTNKFLAEKFNESPEFTNKLNKKIKKISSFFSMSDSWEIKTSDQELLDAIAYFKSVYQKNKLNKIVSKTSNKKQEIPTFNNKPKM